MRLLIVSQYFWPESFIINDLARILRDLGHVVVVATGKPNYPEGKTYAGYSSGGVQKEVFSGNIEVFRVPLRPRGRARAIDLLLNYFSFVWSGLIWFPIMLRGRDFDAILVFAGSPNVAIPAIPLKWTQKAHLALWIQDLWPESLSATGFIRNRTVLKLVEFLVRGTYFAADTLLVQSRAFIAPVSRLAKRGKVFYYPNSLDSTPPDALGSGAVDPELLSVLKENFCVVFAGNIGTAQAVETLVDAALHLKDLPQVRLVLVGSGSMLEWVRTRKVELGLDNVVLAGRYPMNAMPGIFAHASCLVVTLKDEEIFSYTIPSKVQAYLAAARPIVAAINGEGARVVEEAGAGLTCAAEDALALANCVRRLHAMPESDRLRMGDAGRRYFLEKFEMRGQAVELIDLLEKRIAEGKPAGTSLN
jgi:glycosyltransferase involved in cell wall biosynthesis